MNTDFEAPDDDSESPDNPQNKEPPPSPPPQSAVNRGEEDFMYLYAYRRDKWKVILLLLAIVCTLGILGLIFYWRRDWYVKLSCHRTSVEDADVFILEDVYQDVFVSPVFDLATKKRFYKKPPTGSVVDHAPLITPSLTEKGSFDDVKNVKYFDCKRVRYLYNSTTGDYEKLQGIPDVNLEYFETHSKGLDDLSRSQRLVLFGLNAIAIKVNSIPKILLKEGLTPFYAFQVFSICLWYYEPYTVYASVIVGITVLSLSTQVFETWRQQNALRKRVQDYDVVQILKQDGSVQSIQSETLVPGDIVIVPRNGAKIVYDAVLLSGHCIINESSLTGESVPVSKVPISSADKDQFFNIRANNRSVLFCGTKLLQSRGVDNENARAMVIRTGFMTAKGELIRSIVYFRRVDFKFQNQTFWYILALALMAAVGMIYAIIVFEMQTKNDGTKMFAASDIIVRALDLVTIVVPPALPAALTVGIIFSQYRLKKHKIFCISPRTINMCGLLNLVCFDKTGTLTEDGLDLKSILPAGGSENKDANFRELTSEMQFGDAKDPLVRGMAVCHSLSLMIADETHALVGDQSENIIGDPLDLIMFQYTHWKLVERSFPGFGTTIFRVVHSPFIGRRSVASRPSVTVDENTQGLILFREFPFASTFQRMGVIVFNSFQNRFESYIKGSAEKVIPLCNRNSVPSDWTTRLEEFSSKGNRVIALAWKPLDVANAVEANKVSRSESEHDLQFVGLIVFENRIKPDTPAAIEELYQANIRNVMLTGDNMHTAISVARTAGILRPHDHLSIVNADEVEVHFDPVASNAAEVSLDTKKAHNGPNGFRTQASLPNGDAEASLQNRVLAMSGDTLQLIKKFHPHVMPQIVLEGAVFARVSPLEKQFMVEQFQGAGYQVAMCGDGANDCGALRAAHAGISLSESEAAAAAPFTSTNPSIACVPLVLREGRCALVTFFGIFFLMATYSMAQFSACVLVYWTGVTLTDWQFLYQDLFELTILAIVIAFTLPYDRLTKDTTPSSLKSFPALFSLVGHVLLILGAQIIAFKFVEMLPCDTSSLRTAAENATEDTSGIRAKVNGDFSHIPGNSCETYAVFTVGILQIVFLSFVFSRGPPFRKPFYTNWPHLLLATGMIAFDLTCMLGPTKPILATFEMAIPSAEVFSSRFIFLAIALGYMVLALLFERIVIDILVTKCLDRSKRLKSWRSTRRSDVEDELRETIVNSYAARELTYRNLAFASDENLVDHD